MTSLPDNQPPLSIQSDRDHAVQRVQGAYADGVISLEEMDACLDRVLIARTGAELDVVLAALPAEAAPRTSTISAASGRIKRDGAWRVPRFLKVESAFGRVHLDLSRAVIEDPVVDIELQVGTGRAKITVPFGAVVDLDGLTTGWKDIDYRIPRRTQPAGPTIRISGVMGYGRLTVRHASR
ncbi:DUF1707 SHOCT-like domain-containing protein [Streptomyces sp. NRRL WC-3742]|uniref:DUF1707 SHOCT-like domain-containing protein n=1 Tax=Streptomyces sp. NRRL WC-3742 TaxID=1463934 RepID=UPI0004C81028|nr:DUF1707 domain-containing protein [Streptomyces sp. NRRL WC-3742]